MRVRVRVRELRVRELRVRVILFSSQHLNETRRHIISALFLFCHSKKAYFILFNSTTTLPSLRLAPTRFRIDSALASRSFIITSCLYKTSNSRFKIQEFKVPDVLVQDLPTVDDPDSIRHDNSCTNTPHDLLTLELGYMSL